MKGQHVCLHFGQETWDQAIVSMVQENIFLFESTLTSAGDSLPEWIKIWNTDTSVEFNYALNIHWVLILNIKAFQGQIFHLTYTSGKLKYVQWCCFYIALM